MPFSLAVCRHLTQTSPDESMGAFRVCRTGDNRAMASLLQDRLDAITSRTRALVQPDRLAISEKALSELFATGIEDQVLRAGSPAPSFTLIESQNGKPVSSSDLLALGPVVIKFFRGRWDPYCVTELEAWRDLHTNVRSHGSIFVAISPQNRRQNDFAAQQHELPFPLLSDPGSEVAAQFGLAHTVPPEHRRYFRSILINIPFANSGLTYDTAPDSSWRLPLPGLFLIRPDGKTGTIAYSSAFADPRVRPEPEDLLALLEASNHP
jgi:peroxiredoxin